VLSSLALPLFAGLMLLALTLAGCSSAATTSGGSPTATNGSGGGSPTATTSTSGNGDSGSNSATPVPAPPHAFGWYQMDAHHVPQIWASLNGGVPKQITHVAPDGAACDDQVAWSPPVFSPSLEYIVAALGSFNCGDGVLSGALSIINVSSGAITPVPGSPNTTIRLTVRSAGWISNQTLWYINTNGFYSYSLGGGPPTLVSPLSNPEDAVVRDTTLFWSNFTSGGVGPGGSLAIHRYDIGAHASLPGSISLGSVGACHCSPGDYGVPGWDVSADGAHVVYQVVTPGSSGSANGVASSRFYYANADGSGATQIAHVATAQNTVRMQLSPNGQLVSISGALPSPGVVVGSVTSPGNSGDPSLHFFTPDDVAYPVWKWDSSEFWAARIDAGQYSGSGSPTPALYSFHASGGSGALAVNGGFNPWYTIGS